MQLFDKQCHSIDNSIARLNLWDGAVQSGKTVASIMRWIDYIGSDPVGKLIMTGKTERTLQRNVLEPMKEYLGDDFSYSMGNGEAYLWDRLIYLYGANDERSEGKLRGLSGVVGAYGDEVSLWPESYFKMMLSRMSASMAKAFLSTNPDNPNHWLYKNFILRAPELNMSYFPFRLDDNVFLPPEYVEALKLEYVGLWFKRFILGLWVSAEGAIYDFFDEDLHVIDKCPSADYYIVGVDYGTANATFFGLFGVKHRPLIGQPKVWLAKEYYYSGREHHKSKTDSEYADDFVEFLAGRTPQAIYIDPSASSFKAELKKRGILFIKNADNSVVDGIRFQGSCLYKGLYKIYRECKRTIGEYFSYIWDKKAQERGEDKPKKVDDHSKDGERYALWTHFGTKKLDYSKLLTV